VFDVETTGLLKENPYIIQFSFVLYNLETRTIERKHDFYINPPVEIPEKITEITGITKELCIAKSVPIILALDCFYYCYTMCSSVIAHNIKFDTSVITIEINRNREIIEKHAHYCLNIFDKTFEKNRGIKQFCTMRYSTSICNIMVSRTPSSSTKYKKWPTLLEFHQYLFNSVPNNLHNSITDVLVCLRCYLKSFRKITVEDAEFIEMLRYLTTDIL